MRHRRLRSVSPILLLLALLAPGGAAWAEEATVNLGHNRVEPARVTVGPGDVVRFHNQDEMPGGHTVVADDGSFQSPPLGKDEDFRRTFEEVGSFGFHIKEHPGAKGTVVVE